MAHLVHREQPALQGQSESQALSARKDRLAPQDKLAPTVLSARKDQQGLLDPRDRWEPLERWVRKVLSDRRVWMVQPVRKDQQEMLGQ